MDFYKRFKRWDNANKISIDRLFPDAREHRQRYDFVDQPDSQLFVTDFRSHKSHLQRTILEKLDTLRALRDLAGASFATATMDGVGAAHAARQARVLIGHGRSPHWRELRDFLQDSLELPWEELNREPVGLPTGAERLERLLEGCSMALLVLTAEEERSNGTFHAREHVLHEAGLFQGRRGIRRAILLVEEGCTSFSSIEGLQQIRFPAGDLSARFEDVRRILIREGVLEESYR
jgi:hypothetical protein